MAQHGHARADRRHLLLHRAALTKLGERPELRQACLALVEAWLEKPELSSSRGYLETWREMLAGWPLERLSSAVLDEAGGQALRQCSPLGPALGPRERWAVLAEADRVDPVGGGR